MWPLLLLLAAAEPEPRTGTLILDAEMPVIAMSVAGVPLRLRVDLDQRDVVELNPDAAARLPLAWESGFDADLGGVTLDGRQAAGETALAGRKVRLRFSSHGRDCCPGADGAIGPLLLPYATVRWVRAGTAAGVPRRHTMTDDPQDGLTVAEAGIAVQLSIAQPETLASRAAGVLLADAHGGRYAGPFAQVAGPFGVPRATRTVAFARPPVLLGFALPTLRVRAGDFGGRLDMPEERARPGDIVVQRRGRAQRRWPVVMLGRDQLGRCSEIAFHADSLTLDLVCPVAGAAGAAGAAGGRGRAGR